jgi:hypothetical protein
MRTRPIVPCRALVDGLHRFRIELPTITDRELSSSPRGRCQAA